MSKNNMNFWSYMDENWGIAIMLACAILMVASALSEYLSK